jgi:Lon protease-like protein
MATQRIPLFPLNVVLFPGALLPLHIFELRYKSMIGRCLEEHAAFGVVLAAEEGLATVGCTAQILQVAKTYDDGRMDIVTLGESPYGIHELHDDEAYLEGDVELLPDDPQPGPAATAGELRTLYQQCYRLLHAGPVPATEEDEDRSPTLAYQIAANLPLPLEARQALLEIRVEADRRALLLQQLQQALPDWARIHAARAKSAGNGHRVN